MMTIKIAFQTNNILKFSISRIIVIAFQVINLKLITNNLDIKELGLYFVILTASYFANALIFVPVDYYQQANLMKIIGLTGGIKPLLNLNLKLILAYLIFVGGGLVISLLFFENYFYYILVAAILAVELYVVQSLRNMLNNLDKRNVVAISFIQESLIKVLVFYVLIIYVKPNEITPIIAWLSTLLLNIIFLAYQTNKYCLFKSNKIYFLKIKDIFKFTYPVSIGAIGSWVQLQGFRLILAPYGYVDIIGIFSAVSNIGSVGMGAVSTVYSQTYSPEIYKTNGKYTRKYLIYALWLVLAVIIASVLLGPYIVKIATADIFVKYWGLIIVGVLIEAINLLINGLFIHISLAGETKKMIITSIFGAVTVMSLYALIFLTNSINIYTIGLPLVAAQLATLSSMYIFYKKCKL